MFALQAGILHAAPGVDRLHPLPVADADAGQLVAEQRGDVPLPAVVELHLHAEGANATAALRQRESGQSDAHAGRLGTDPRRRVQRQSGLNKAAKSLVLVVFSLVKYWHACAI